MKTRKLSKFKLNLKKDKKDLRDRRFQTYWWLKLDGNFTSTFDLTAAVDLRKSPLDPPVRDQEDLGSCTAFATTALVDFCRDNQELSNSVLSPLFTYYTTRMIERTVNFDSGASIRGSLKSAVKYGVVEEEYWPYVIANFTTRPTQAIFDRALNCQILSYYRINNGNLYDMLRCLAEGYPFTFGFKVFSQFESEQCLIDGIVAMPQTGDKTVGGHAMLVVGWKEINSKKYFICQNSWGTEYGDGGFWYMPFEYLANKKLARDCWTVRIVES